MEKASVEIESKLDSCLGCCLSIDDSNRSLLIFQTFIREYFRLSMINLILENLQGHGIFLFMNTGEPQTTIIFGPPPLSHV